MTYTHGGGLSDIGEAILEHVEQLNQRGDDLRGIRCGTPVCEHLLELDAAGRITIDSIAQDGDAWLLDLSPA